MPKKKTDDKWPRPKQSTLTNPAGDPDIKKIVKGGLGSQMESGQPMTGAPAAARKAVHAEREAERRGLTAPTNAFGRHTQPPALEKFNKKYGSGTRENID